MIQILIKKIHLWFLELYDRLTSKVIEVSIGDIFLHSPYPCEIRFLVVSRLLDFKRYSSSKDDSFIYQNTISYARYGERHNEEKGNRAFKNLIESYKKNGYDINSLVTLDKNLNLVDGTHRLSLCLASDQKTVNARIIKRRTFWTDNIDWFYKIGLPSHFVSELKTEYQNVYRKLIDEGCAFKCQIMGELNPALVHEIKSDLENLSGGVYNNVRQLSSEKIYIFFDIHNPNYVIDNTIVSLRAIEIENILRQRYSCKNIIISVSHNCLI